MGFIHDFLRSHEAHKIVNKKGRTVLDVSGADGASVIGYNWKDGDNQKWYFKDYNENRVLIQNKATGRYLVPQENANRNGIPVVSAGREFHWEIREVEGDDRAVKFIWPGWNKALDLSDHGNSTPGTFVQVWDEWPGENQVWYIERA